MKYLLLCLVIFSSLCFAELKEDPNTLKPEDQKFFKNDYGEGLNKFERIDQSTKQINIVMGDVQALKKEIEELKARITELENSKK